ASLVDGLPESRPDACQQGCAESGAFLGLDGFHLLAENIGLDLPPKRRSSAAAAQADLLHRYLQLGKNRKRVTETECDALQDGANHVGARVMRRKTNQSAPDVRVAIGRTFAHQIRGPQYAL